MKLIVGLGNPGDKYLNTRHNLGFMALESYAKKHLGPKIEWEQNQKFESELLKINESLLIKPNTFMNNSGLAIVKLLKFYKIPLNDLIVVHDDLDLPLGKIKIRLGGSGAGHHGIESVIKNTGGDQFVRVRLGIGNLKSQGGERGGHFNADTFVVNEFSQSERAKVKQILKHSVEALDLILKVGLETAQNKYN